MLVVYCEKDLFIIILYMVNCLLINLSVYYEKKYVVELLLILYNKIINLMFDNFEVYEIYYLKNSLILYVM